jgi:hypothetical protein
MDCSREAHARHNQEAGRLWVNLKSSQTAVIDPAGACASVNPHAWRKLLSIAPAPLRTPAPGLANAHVAVDPFPAPC